MCGPHFRVSLSRGSNHRKNKKNILQGLLPLCLRSYGHGGVLSSPRALKKRIHDLRVLRLNNDQSLWGELIPALSHKEVFQNSGPVLGFFHFLPQCVPHQCACTSQVSILNLSLLSCVTSSNHFFRMRYSCLPFITHSDTLRNWKKHVSSKTCRFNSMNPRSTSVEAKSRGAGPVAQKGSRPLSVKWHSHIPKRCYKSFLGDLLVTRDRPAFKRTVFVVVLLVSLGFVPCLEAILFRVPGVNYWCITRSLEERVDFFVRVFLKHKDANDASWCKLFIWRSI